MNQSYIASPCKTHILYPNPSSAIHRNAIPKSLPNSLQTKPFNRGVTHCGSRIPTKWNYQTHKTIKKQNPSIHACSSHSIYIINLRVNIRSSPAASSTCCYLPIKLSFRSLQFVFFCELPHAFRDIWIYVLLASFGFHVIPLGLICAAAVPKTHTSPAPAMFPFRPFTYSFPGPCERDIHIT